MTTFYNEDINYIYCRFCNKTIKNQNQTRHIISNTHRIAEEKINRLIEQHRTTENINQTSFKILDSTFLSNINDCILSELPEKLKTLIIKDCYEGNVIYYKPERIYPQTTYINTTYYKENWIFGDKNNTYKFRGFLECNVNSPIDIENTLFQEK